MKKRILVLILIGALAISLVSGCTSSKKSSSSSTGAMPTITWFSTKGGFDKAPPDNVILKEIEKQTGVKINLISPPFASYAEKVALTMASGDLPDVIRITTIAEWKSYVDQGAFQSVDGLLKQAPNLQKVIPKEALDLCKVNGKQYAIPVFTSQHRYNPLVRQDWLDNVGIKTAPVTLTDTYNMLLAFKNGNPNGDGKKVYGISGRGMLGLYPILGAFGVMAPETGYFYNDKGVMKPQATNPQAKVALSVLSQWYAEGLIDPEMFTMTNDDQLNQKAYKNQFGYTNQWWTWESKAQIEMQKVNPKAVWARIAPPVGPSGLSGTCGTNWVNNLVCVTKSAKNMTAIAKVMDYYHSDPGMLTPYSGVEGIHWEKRTDGKYYTLPQFDTDAKWIQWYSFFELEPALFQIQTPLLQSRLDSLKWNVIPDTKNQKLTDAEVKSGADLTTLVNTAYWQIISGQKPISYFDDFVKAYNAAGGTDWTNQVNAKK